MAKENAWNCPMRKSGRASGRRRQWMLWPAPDGAPAGTVPLRIKCRRDSLERCGDSGPRFRVNR